MPGSIPKELYLDINTIEKDIDNCIIEYFDKYNIDIYDLSQRKYITHNILTNCFMFIYDKLFKPNTTLCNNQSSLIDYNNTDMLKVIANKYINICSMFNKSLGLYPFSYLTGINGDTLNRWLHEKESNPTRYEIIKSIKESHKQAQISLLNDSPVGALAVANNDIETGLEWSKQNAQQIASNTVYILPSERVDKLRITKEQDNNVV